MRRAIGGLAVLVVTMAAAGCHGKGIDSAAGCDQKLSAAHKRQECHACVAASHVYMPDKPDGSRCQQ